MVTLNSRLRLIIHICDGIFFVSTKKNFYVLFQIHIHRSFQHVNCLRFHLASRCQGLRWSCKTPIYGRNFIKSVPKWLSQNAAGESSHIYLKCRQNETERVHACDKMDLWVCNLMHSLFCAPAFYNEISLRCAHQTPHTSKSKQK